MEKYLQYSVSGFSENSIVYHVPVFFIKLATFKKFSKLQCVTQS